MKDNFFDRLQEPLTVKVACLLLLMAVVAALLVSPLVSFAEQGTGKLPSVVTASFIDISQSPTKTPFYPHDTRRKDLKIGDILDLAVSGRVITGKYTGNNLVTVSNKSLKLTFPNIPRSAPILDLHPLSMSFIGSRDCQVKATFICRARVLSSGKNAQGNLNWIAYVDFPGHVVFDPPNGSLAPNKAVIVTINIPLNACKPGLFYFQGPVDTHTITWACHPKG